MLSGTRATNKAESKIGGYDQRERAEGCICHLNRALPGEVRRESDMRRGATNIITRAKVELLLQWVCITTLRRRAIWTHTPMGRKRNRATREPRFEMTSNTPCSAKVTTLKMVMMKRSPANSARRKAS